MRALVNYKEIMRLMNEGILMEDGTIREFDIIDFYQNCYMSIESFYDRYIKRLSVEDAITLEKFIKKYVGEFMIRDRYSSEFKKNDEWLIRELINSVDLYKNSDFDENGNYIVGSGRRITDEEKVEAYDYMKSFGHYVTYKMVDCAINRIANNIPFEIAKKNSELELTK